MNPIFFPQEKQPEEFLAYLGVSRRSIGWRCLLACVTETVGGCEPGLAVYERVGLAHGLTAAQVFKSSQRALLRAREKAPQAWAEVFPGLKIDVDRTGLTPFLCRASVWLRHNRIGYVYMEGVKCRILAPGQEESPAAIENPGIGDQESGEMLDKSRISDIII